MKFKFFIIFILLGTGVSGLNSTFCENYLGMNLSLVVDVNACDTFLDKINDTSLTINNLYNVNQTTVNNITNVSYILNQTIIQNYTNVFNSYNISGETGDVILEQLNETLTSYINVLAEENKLQNLERNFTLKELQLKHELELLKVKTILNNTGENIDLTLFESIKSKVKILEDRLNRNQAQDKDNVETVISSRNFEEYSSPTKGFSDYLTLTNILIIGVVWFIGDKQGWWSKLSKNNESPIKHEATETTETGLFKEIQKVNDGEKENKPNTF